MTAGASGPLRLQHWIRDEPHEDAQRLLAAVAPAEPRRQLAVVPCAGRATVAHAVRAASEAAPAWARRPGPQRAAFLLRWAAAIQSATDALAETMAHEVGKPIGEARGEVARAVAILHYYAGEAVRDAGEVIPAQGEGSLQIALRRPLGVVGLITPWNFPLAIPLWKAAPALAFGNCVVWKPSELAGLSADLLARTAREAALPAGTFAVVHGDGTTGGLIAAEAGIAAVSFTGSGVAGRKVVASASSRGARVQAEMGGKNVAVVAADADLERAAAAVAAGAFRFAGQKCTATSRVVVDRAVRAAFLAALRRAADTLPVLPPLEPDCAVGPVITATARARIEQAVAAAAGEVLWQGQAPAKPGHWVEPRLIGGIDASAPLAQEELFGPVLCWFEADGLDAAIQLANSTRYGLSAALFTRDLRSAMHWATRIDAGMVRVNADTTGVDPHAPFGGVKASGCGGREQGPAAREFYTELRTLQFDP